MRGEDIVELLEDPAEVRLVGVSHQHHPQVAGEVIAVGAHHIEQRMVVFISLEGAIDEQRVRAAFEAFEAA